MDDLLALAIKAHGGMKRWDGLSRFRSKASMSGAILDLNQRPGLLTDVVLDGDSRDQRLRMAPFPSNGRYAIWQPDHQTIETTQGIVLAERRDPISSFRTPDLEPAWDDLQIAYFASTATWNYLVTPFLFARPDFVVQEIGPWSENGQVWRRLFVTYPDNVAFHSRQQTYYFDGEGSLRRVDYVVDILGSAPVVDLPTWYRVFDGIRVPTRRRVYVRKPDGSPDLESISVAVDIRRVTFD
jgi:hypothetical protein